MEQIVEQSLIPRERLLQRTVVPAMEYIAPAPPVTDSLPSHPVPPAFTSFLERLKVVAAPSPQGVKGVIRATVNELSAASDEARLKRVFDAALTERADQANWKPSHQKGKEGQTQKVSDSVRDGHRLPETVSKYRAFRRLLCLFSFGWI